MSRPPRTIAAIGRRWRDGACGTVQACAGRDQRALTSTNRDTGVFCGKPARCVCNTHFGSRPTFEVGTFTNPFSVVESLLLKKKARPTEIVESSQIDGAATGQHSLRPRPPQRPVGVGQLCSSAGTPQWASSPARGGASHGPATRPRRVALAALAGSSPPDSAPLPGRRYLSTYASPPPTHTPGRTTVGGRAVAARVLRRVCCRAGGTALCHPSLLWAGR